MTREALRHLGGIQGVLRVHGEPLPQLLLLIPLVLQLVVRHESEILVQLQDFAGEPARLPLLALPQLRGSISTATTMERTCSVCC